MKKEITTALLTLATALGFAQEAIPEVLPNIARLETVPALPSLKEKVSAKGSFGYLRMGVSDSNLQTTDVVVLPGFGLGYRIVSGSSAIDISASFNRRDTITDEGKERTYLYSAPKANYFYYTNAASAQSFYAGGGLAWGGVKTEETNFIGLIPNVAVGYELNRTGAIRTFVQLDVSQPAIAALKEGNLPKTFAEFSVGAGF
jgi:hypothetical protein